MYRFSRSIYRDLAPYVIADPVNEGFARAVAPTNGARTNGFANGPGHPAANGNGNAGSHAAANSNGSDHANGNGNPGGHDQAGGGATNRRRLLAACERTMRRLAHDRRYFAHPARSLFGEVRCYFPIHEQDRAWRVIERNVNLALEHLARLPGAGVGLDGRPSECRAHTRKGRPCQRQPLPGRDYCPSHKHLEESLEPIDALEAPDERTTEPPGSVGAAA